MAFDKPTRNLLAKMTAACRDRLASDISDQLQSLYGLYPDGSALDVARTADDRQAVADLQALLDHFAQAESGPVATRRAEAYKRLLREIGFTLLNRLAALRLCEERGLLIECVRQGMESAGFRLYDQVANGALGNRYQTYRAFLEGIFDELALDLGVLFDRHTPQSRIFPSEAALTDVLQRLNDAELAARQIWQQDETIGWIYQYYNDPNERKAMRDASQAPRTSRELAVRNQFFTPRYVVEFLTDNTLGRIWYEMRRGKTRLAEQCRYLVRRPLEVFMDGRGYAAESRHPAVQAAARGDLSQLPETMAWDDLQQLALCINGYELAPALGLGECANLANARLAEYRQSGQWRGNSLELWLCLFFEQRRWRHFGESPEGDDLATMQALYAALRQALQHEREETDQEKLLRAPVYVPQRKAKDPRNLKVLDPAGGSGHFLLYAFDLLVVIYEEAWETDEVPAFSETGRRLREDYPDLSTLRREIPGLILRHNLHGIDIDPRAVQIAALALWLRAQRAYQELGLPAAQRPAITKSNLVTAEPMPGDETLLKEFTATLRPTVLGELLRKVVAKMKLAGEAGSLLKIEEELREDIAAAHRQWASAGDKGEQLALFPELEKPRARQISLFDVSDVSDEQFFETAEARLLEELERYASQAENGQGARRRLFAEDAARGFAFIDLCRKHYDVSLMNPPFGSSAMSSTEYLDYTWPRTKCDLFASFVERGLGWLTSGGLLGAITSRTGFFLSSFESWRKQVLSGSDRLVCLADLGSGVLDDAAVETATYALSKDLAPSSLSSCFKLDESEPDDRAGLLVKAIARVLKPTSSPTDSSCKLVNYYVRPSEIRALPGFRLVYWIPPSVRGAFVSNPRLRDTGLAACVGLQTNNDFRFVRAYWEIIPSRIGRDRIWCNFAKGGEYSPFYDDIHLLVNWRGDGYEIKENTKAMGNSPSRHVVSENYYFQAGLTYINISSVGFSIQPLPAGTIFSIQGQYLGSHATGLPFGFMTSSTVNVLLDIINPGRHYQAGQVQLLPMPASTPVLQGELNQLASTAYGAKRAQAHFIENSREFLYPLWVMTKQHVASERAVPSAQADAATRYLSQLRTLIVDAVLTIDCKVLDIYGFDTQGSQFVNRESISFRNSAGLYAVSSALEYFSTSDRSVYAQVSDSVGYAIGCGFGRWDIRLAIDSTLAPKLQDPFDPLPVCPPGMLVGADGLPVTPGRIVSEEWLRARPNAITLPPEGSVKQPTIPDSDYPIHIAWDGILVDDPGLNGEAHANDIVRRVREVLAVLWPQTYESIEAEACEILGVRDLREYFRRPAGFFADHLKRYSKSRRQAPIYWPLSTASGSYTLWLYYHRLDSEMLYTAVNRYVKPKIEQVERHIARLEGDLSATFGRAASEVRDSIDAARAFLRELRDFQDELLRVAALPYQPDLNDGVVINAAPLHRLFRHSGWRRDTEKVWKALEAGAYDWAHMAYVLWPERVRKVCTTDRSIAIAHGLEHLCTASVKAKGKGRKVEEEEEEEDEGEG